MLRFEDFSGIASIQSTIFTPGFSFDSPLVLRRLLEIEGSDLFDGAPTVLPIPEDAPREIPRITLQSSNRFFTIDVAPSRTNLYRTKSAEDDIININDFITFSSQFLTNYMEIVNARCGRIAAIIRRFAVIENPGHEIAEHFCKEEFMVAPFNRPGSFEIHAHKVYDLSDFDQVNSWVRIRSGVARFTDRAQQHAIIIEQDINTLSEEMENRDYSEQQINRFFEIVADEFDIILRFYLQTT